MTIVVVALMSGAATADVSTERIALESYSGPRPREAQRPMAALRDALAARRFVAQPAELTKVIGEQLPRPGASDRDFTARVFAQEIEAGENLHIDANYRAAAARLAAAIDRMHQNSGLHDAQSRELKLKGLVLLSQSYARMSADPGNRDAQLHARARDEAMFEVLRSYPSKVITVKQFGPEGERLWRAAVNAQPKRGILTIRVSDPDVLIYVNEIPRGDGAITLGDLVPGPYRVLMVPPSGASRLFTVTVRETHETQLRVDWDVASALVVGQEYVGLSFDTEVARRREGLLARRFARAHGGSVVAVLTANQSRKGLVLAGALYRVGSGELVRSGMVELGHHDDTARIAQLASRLDPDADTATPLVLPAVPDDYTPIPLDEAPTKVARQRFAPVAPRIEREDVVLAPSPAPASSESPRLWPGLFPPPVSSGEGRAPLWRKIALVSGGLVAVGAGVYLVSEDGDPTCGGGVVKGCPYVRNTGVIGWTAVASGAIAISIGAWLHVKRPAGATIAAVPGRGGGVALARWLF